jgi:hypothetical protein
MSARPRLKRIRVATSDDAWRGPTGQLRLPALRLPLFFWRRQFVALFDKTRMRMHRESGIARAIRPRYPGQAGPRDLTLSNAAASILHK